MSKPLRLLSCLSAVVLAGLTLASCGGGIPADAVVKVGSSPITTATFNHWMAIAAASAAASTSTSTSTSKAPAPVPPDYSACIAHLRKTAAKPAKGKSAPTTATLKSECAKQYASYKQEVLGFLVSSEWLLGEAAALHVQVSNKEVEKEFAKDKKEEFPTEASFKKFLAETGFTVSDLELRIKVEDMLPTKIEKQVEASVKPVTKAQIASYYKLHQSTYGTAEKKNLLIVLTKTEAQAQAAKAEIASGQSFASVAKRVSIDPTSKKNGAKLLDVVRGEEEKALESAVFTAKEHVLSGPVKTPFGYYIFEVTKTIAATQDPLSKVQSTIKSQLTETAKTSALDAFVKRFQKKWKALTECRSGFVISDCKQYKTPSTTSTTTTAG